MASRADEIDKMQAELAKNDTKVMKFRKEWMIKNLPSVPKDKDHMLDLISSKNPNIGDEWNAMFRASFNPNKGIYQLNFSVKHSNTPLKIPIVIKFQFMILTGDTVKISRSEDKFCGITTTSGLIFQANVEYLNQFIINGNVTIALEVTMITNQDDMSLFQKIHKLTFHIQENHMSREMELLFIQQKSGDFTFKFGDKKLLASKDILSARSPVFARMFDEESDFKENKEKCVDIVDIDYDVFREMLFYIYTDRAPRLNEMTEGLLAAAEKYQLKHLKIICEKALDQNISLENAFDTLNLSDKYNCVRLKFHSLRFIAMHEAKIMESEAYKSLLATDSARAEELICEVSNHHEYLQELDTSVRRIVIIT